MPPEPSERDVASLVDIDLAAADAIEFCQGMTFDAFAADRRTRWAVVKQLEIIGEATKRLSPAFRAQATDIPWSTMAGMRDRLTHAYDAIDLAIVWRVVHQELPDLRRSLAVWLPSRD